MERGKGIAAALAAILTAAWLGGCAHPYRKEARRLMQYQQHDQAANYYLAYLHENPGDAEEAAVAIEVYRGAFEKARKRFEETRDRGEWLTALGHLDRLEALNAAAARANIPAVEFDLRSARKATENRALQASYHAGKEALSSKQYRECTELFRFADALSPGYKDARARFEECKNLGTITIIVSTGKHTAPALDQRARAIAHKLVSQALSSQYDFLRFVDREDIDRVYGEQANSVKLAFEKDDFIKLGKLQAAHVIVRIKVLDAAASDSGWVPQTTSSSLELDKKCKDSNNKEYNCGKETAVAHITRNSRRTRADLSLGYDIIDTNTAAIVDSADLRDALESTATTVSCTGDQRAFHWECYSTRPGDPLSKDELLGRLTENLGSRLARQAAEFLERRYNKRGTGRPNG